MTRDPLALLAPADPSLYYRRDDPNDPRMGERVLRGAGHLDGTGVALVGCPQDEGVRRNKGRTGAAQGPAEIRRALYRYPVSAAHQGLRLVDLGDVPAGATLEETHEALRAVVRCCLARAAKVVVLGGGNDISYADCSALALEQPDLLAFNIDRHLDLRADPVRNSGTPYRQLLEEGFLPPGRFHEVGINSFANSQAYLRYAEAREVGVHQLADLRARGVGAAVRALAEASPAKAIFFGFDLDVVHAAEAPGVSDPSPMGLTAQEVCEIADVAAGDPRTRVIEISELNPVYDRDNITARLAANILMRGLARV
jgi:formiminoglutamase